jgi:hypothetical protein
MRVALLKFGGSQLYGLYESPTINHFIFSLDEIV